MSKNKCPVCNGEGWLFLRRSTGVVDVDCDACEGTGKDLGGDSA